MDNTRNIFKLIQLPGSKPGDANWETARWGFADWDSLFKNMFDESNDAEQSSAENKSQDFQRKIDGTLAPFKKEPKQTKLTSYFRAKMDYRDAHTTSAANSSTISDAPTTSAAYLASTSATSTIMSDAPTTSTGANSTTISDYYLQDEDDELILAAVQSNESQASAFDQRMELEVFWKKVEKDQKVEQHQIAHRHNLAKIKLKDRADNERMKKQIGDVFWPIREWPSFAVEILLSPTFNYNERLTFATFFHGNGMKDATWPIQIIRFYNKHWKNAHNHYHGWKQKFHKFEMLFKYLDKAKDSNDPEYHRIGHTYYYYSMIAKHMLYYNGNKRKEGNQYEFVVNNY